MSQRQGLSGRGSPCSAGADRALLAAYCKNSVDGLWYCFDDSDVQQLSEDEVCTQMAYILFYQRRTAIPSWSANSSVAGEAPRFLGSFSQNRRLSLMSTEIPRRCPASVSLVRLILTFAFNLGTKMIAVKEMRVACASSCEPAEFTGRGTSAGENHTWGKGATKQHGMHSESRGNERLGRRTETWLCHIVVGDLGARPVQAHIYHP